MLTGPQHFQDHQVSASCHKRATFDSRPLGWPVQGSRNHRATPGCGCSGRRSDPDAHRFDPRYLDSVRVFLVVEVESGLQVGTEHCRSAEIAGKAQRGVRAGPRLLCTIALILGVGTPIAMASAFWLIPSGRRNSSRRISPGVSGA